MVTDRIPNPHNFFGWQGLAPPPKKLWGLAEVSFYPVLRHHAYKQDTHEARLDSSIWSPMLFRELPVPVKQT
jgi:hypothetical protein